MSVASGLAHTVIYKGHNCVSKEYILYLLIIESAYKIIVLYIS